VSGFRHDPVGTSRRTKVAKKTATAATPAAENEGLVETGIRIRGVLCAAVAELAIKRRHSLDTVARLAMRKWARERGVTLDGGDRVADTRTGDEELRAATERKVWVAYPEAWRPGLARLMAADPSLSYQSGLWKNALVAACRDGGTLVGG